ncbi:hypothetical protein Hdeb2414_s0794g00947791 [Helianthus debilis subsp. tardiflorus]
MWCRKSYFVLICFTLSLMFNMSGGMIRSVTHLAVVLRIVENEGVTLNFHIQSTTARRVTY